MGMATAIAVAVPSHMTTPILRRVIVSLVIQMLPVEEIYDGASGEDAKCCPREEMPKIVFSCRLLLSSDAAHGF